MTNKDQGLPEGQSPTKDIPVSPDPTVGDDPADAAPSTAPSADTGGSDATTTGDDAPRPSPPGRDVTRTVAGSTWVALIIGAVVLVLLLVFILQNGHSAELTVFFWTWNFPIGVGMLIAAVGGALVAASIGTVRIIQLRHQVKGGK
ncbi:lipopolysaccharide assembly LapA domain-containing protein [uncultured Corynebacterium sp.]|uniref:LapA family protein n=1 Tax=uncultured Corynebacterium sp. TaxID=159447 RepID=UPI0025D33CEF|nr:lipopolysaccharide assembly protein LapA domain-containing protein [uncultured Corynebacterium sp.]